MKAKKLMGVIACAGACVSLSALANTTNDWFSASVQNNDISLTNVSTNGVAVTIDGGKIKLDNEPSSALAFSPVATNMSTGVAVITAKAELTPTEVDGFGTDFGSAKVGFAVGVDGENTNYYGYASGVWFALTGATPPATGDTTFKIVLDYRTAKAQFFVDDDDTILSTNNVTTFDFNVGSATALGSVAAFGSGSLTEVNGGFELAVAAYGGNKYGSIAEASDAAKAASVADPTAAVQVVNSDGSTEEAGATAANGLSKIVCEALGLAMNDSAANIVVAPAATDTDANNITLAVDIDGAPEASAVKYGVTPAGGTTTYYDNASAVKIPLAAGTYTITPVLK